MRITNIIFIIILFFSCDNIEFKSYYPANPPTIDDLIHLSGGTYGGDYLLLFRSSNILNSRFGGFLIYTGATEADVLQKVTQTDASYILGIANGESSSLYNPAGGIDTQLAILFSNQAAPANNILVYNIISYTLIKTLPPVPELVSGNWMIMRAYLWDSTNKVILEVSNPGNVVQID
jgi:hypothetical protein